MAENKVFTPIEFNQLNGNLLKKVGKNVQEDSFVKLKTFPSLKMLIVLFINMEKPKKILVSLIPAVMTFGPGLYKKTNKPECHLLDYRGYTYGYNRFVKKVIWDEKLYIAYPKCLYAFVNPGTKIKTITLVPREYIVRKSIAYKIEFEKNIQDSIPTLKDSSHCEKCQRKFGSYSYKSNKFGPICFSCALPVENFCDNWCFDYYSQRYFKRVGPLIDVNTKIHGIWFGFSDNDGNTYFKINKCEQTVYQDEHENIILCYLHFD